MKKENALLILWIIYGFVFVMSIDSILYFIGHLFYFIQSGIGISYKILKYSMPVLIFILYISTTFILLNKIRTNSNSEGIFLTEFPRKLFFYLVIIAVFLGPITSKLSGLFAEHSVTMKGGGSEFLEFYGWMKLGFGLSRWLILIALGVYFLKKVDA